MNLPNKLTLMRIMLVPFFVAFLLIDSIPCNYLIALAVFIVASLTDMLDGKIARKYNMVTDFGKFADPLADKILVTAAFACFVQLNIVNAVFIILVLFREFTVTSIRLVAAEQGKVVAANIWGKAKTVSQMIAIIAVLVSGHINQEILFPMMASGSVQTVNPSTVSGIMNTVNQCLLWLSALLTVVSGVIYIKDNFEFIKKAK